MESTDCIFVATGEVKAAAPPHYLIASGIGSCVVITAYNKSSKFGLMAHIMLPGRVYPHKLNYKNRYAFDAIDTLLQLIKAAGYQKEDFIFTLLGGANVIANSACEVGRQNILSIKKYLSQKEIPIAAESLGGLLRRSTRLDLKQQVSYLSVGNEAESIFYDYNI